MNKKLIFSGFLTAAFLSFKTYAYLPDDVVKFENSSDCSHCNLTGYSFGSLYNQKIKNHLVMSESFFTKTGLENYLINDSSITNSNFVKAEFSRNEFNNSTFADINFSYVSIRSTKFNSSKFNKTKFFHANIESSFNSCRFEDIDFSDARLVETSFSKSTFKNVNFENSNLSHANFSRANVEGVSFNNATLDYAILIGSNITTEMLKSVRSLKCTTLADGTVFTNNGEYNCK